MIDRPIMLDQKMRDSEVPAVARNLSHQSCTTPLERVLILMTVLTLPLSNHFPAVAGMSSSFLLFATLGTYVIVSRLRILGQVWLHPVFIAAYVFVGVSILLEFSSPLSRYDECLRFVHMIGGAVFLSVLCRDRSGLAAGLYGYIAAALWVSFYLYLNSYGAMQGIGAAENFNQASKVRAEAFGDMELHANINGLAFVCAQGAVVAFTLALVDNMKHRRILLLGITIFCVVASFLAMSRGAAVVTIVSFTAVLYARGFKHGNALIFACILGLGIYMLVPDAVWSRMEYTTESRSGKMESRAKVYTMALNRLPEYLVAGVGAGNFWNKWGFEKGFAGERNGIMHVSGAHNVFLQITINWGAIGLLSYMAIIWRVYRSIPLWCGRDKLSLALLGIIVSIGPWMLVSHGFYDKFFACGLGILVGARRWIWPTGTVLTVETNRPPLHAQIRPH